VVGRDEVERSSGLGESESRLGSCGHESRDIVGAGKVRIEYVTLSERKGAGPVGDHANFKVIIYPCVHHIGSIIKSRQRNGSSQSQHIARQVYQGSSLHEIVFLLDDGRYILFPHVV